MSAINKAAAAAAVGRVARFLRELPFPLLEQLAAYQSANAGETRVDEVLILPDELLLFVYLGPIGRRDLCVEVVTSDAAGRTHCEYFERSPGGAVYEGGRFRLGHSLGVLVGILAVGLVVPLAAVAAGLRWVRRRM